MQSEGQRIIKLGYRYSLVVGITALQSRQSLHHGHCLWMVGVGMTDQRAEAHQPYLHLADPVWPSQSPGRHEIYTQN